MKNKKHILSFRSKITILCISIVLTALISYHYISSTLFSDTFMQSTKQHTSDNVDLINQNINLMLKRTETYIRLLSIDTEFQSLLNEYQEYSEESIIQYKLPKAIEKITGGAFAPTSEIIECIVSVNNKIIYPNYSIYMDSIKQGLSTEYLSSATYTVSPIWHPSLFKIVPASENTVDVVAKRTTSQNVISLSKKIVDRTKGHTLGIITLLLNENALSSIFENDLGNYYLINPEDKIISCTNKDELYTSIFNVLNITPAELSQLKSSKHITTFHGDHQFMLTLVHNTALNCDLVLYTDLALLTKEQDRVNYLMVTVLLITILIILATVLVSASAITKPIYTLLNVMRDYNHGNITVRAPENINGEMAILSQGFNQLLDKVDQNIKHIEQIQKTQRKLELKILQEQIRPHFLYNALQTAASLIQLKEYDKSIESLYALSDFYEQSLSSGKEVIALKDELSIIENYLKIQHLRYMDYFDFSIEVEEELLDLPIPKLTLQPLVENSIYHGLKHRTQKGILIISGHQMDKENIIEVIDSGVGMTAQQVEEILSNDRDRKTSSFGLKNVFERLQILYESKFSFNIDSVLNEYTTVTLRIANTDEKGELTDV